MLLEISSKIIDLINFEEFFKEYENQKIVENILWFWSNILAEDSDEKSRFFDKIMKESCYLELI